MKINALKIVSVMAFTLGLATAHADVKSDREAVNTACAQDSATASCGTEVVGKGLLKCLHGYKKTHKEFKFSDACTSAMKTLKADHKAKK